MATTGGKKNGRYTHETAMKRMDWNLSASASVEGIADWDLKSDMLAEALLAVLAAGDALFLGTALGGTAVSVTIMSGEQKQRAYARDQEEFDEIIYKICMQARSAKKEQ